jgi:hypothetical protein
MLDWNVSLDGDSEVEASTLAEGKKIAKAFIAKEKRKGPLHEDFDVTVGSNHGTFYVSYDQSTDSWNEWE